MQLIKSLFKKKKKKFYTIPIDIYNGELHISIGETFEEFKNNFTDDFKKRIDECTSDLSECIGGRFNHIDNAFIIRIKDEINTPSDLNILHHELYHFVSHFLNYRGISYLPNNHEAFAYLYGYITEKIYDIL